MKERCYDCTHKFTATHHENGDVTFCNIEADYLGCANFEVARICRCCNHLDYSNHTTCHSKYSNLYGDFHRDVVCPYFEGYGITYVSEENP